MNPPVEVSTSQGITTLTSTVEIPVAKQDVWEVLRFPGKVEELHPLIRKSFMTTNAQNGVGAKRHCDLLPMGAMDEVITEWDEGNGFTIKVTGGKMLPPHRSIQGRFALKALDEERTLVTFSFSYQLKYGLLGLLMDVGLVRPQFRKAPPQYVQGLKNYIIKRKATSPSFS
ncbi:MAG: SRPBCC family protein [Bacteroidota bacterium]